MKTRNVLLVLVATVCAATLVGCKKSKSSSTGATASAAAAPQAGGVAGGSTTPTMGGNPVVPTSSPSQRPRVRVAPRNARNDFLWNLAQRGDFGAICSRGSQGGLKQAGSVSHYYIPPNTSVGDYRCKNGFAYFGQPAMAVTCLHPCRALAADPRYHRPGEVIFFKDLVGLTCGSGKDKMIHDGFMVVTDNGNPDAINTEGRFGIFWGKCAAEQNGFCLDEGAVALDFALTFSSYCRAWRPADPLFHDDIKLAVYNAVRREAVRRGDNHAALMFDLNSFVGLSVDPDGMIYRRFNHPAPWNPFTTDGN